ncbi:3-oxoacyl-[acyl-carrier protein] reductase [Nonomuraea maritima]|uniref:3-oxoacyl-[acyl-carrier protein] reductase n=1 Tax=Nonomuraea maritima TaxID=683260 RepID=A0A1G9JFJ1_9ACTN|nr:SDR family oxidoreductase [Nonomuraea maritima]SDL36035.1 3-oxoacyl-[acyl-carrier protein] reductase [Nonomuraea maritima]
MIDTRLAGKVALVTGANHGIGAATARALAAEDVAVLLTYKRLEPLREPAHPEAYDRVRAGTADEVVRQIRAAGGAAEAVEADLTDPAAPEALFDHAEKAFGPVEILVNNASGWLSDTFAPDEHDRFGRSLRMLGAETHARQFAVDVRAPALLIAEFARRHVTRGATWGRVIGLTSAGRAGFPSEVSYGAAKAAQESYTLSAAHELGRYGITANMVHPPVTDTGWVNDEVTAFAATLPLGTVADPDEVAEVILFLASHQGRRVTGQVVTMY